MKRKRKYETPKVEVLEVRLSDCIANISVTGVTPETGKIIVNEGTKKDFVIFEDNPSWDENF